MYEAMLCEECGTNKDGHPTSSLALERQRPAETQMASIEKARLFLFRANYPFDSSHLLSFG